MKYFFLFASSLFVAVGLASTAAFVPSVQTRSTGSKQLFAEAEIQFVRGVPEKVVPNVRLTRARDGSSGVAFFSFQNPNVFDASTASQGDVTGMFLIDEEGELKTTDVNANFSNGKPQSIESTFVMKSPEEWDRFMRFMERFGKFEFRIYFCYFFALRNLSTGIVYHFCSGIGEANGLGLKKA
jgi:photosystem II 13kDa protein